MNRQLTALFAALEAALVVGVGVGIPLLPLTVLWGAQFNFALDWAVFWRTSVDIWLIGHGVDVTVTMAPELATALGISATDATFPITIAALGFAVITFAMALRAGRRVAETRFRLLGEVAAIGTFAALSAILTATATFESAKPGAVQGVLFPTLIFAAGVILGSVRTRRAEDDENGSSIRDWISDWEPETRAGWVAALKAGTGAVAALLAVASVIVAILLATGYARIIALYESLHTEVLGGIALTIGQLAFLPNLVIWCGSWLVGPGFALGTGSSIGPLATSVGPVPAIPFLGALPEGSLAFGFVGLIVPVLAGFFAAVLVRPALVAVTGEGARGRFVLVGIGTGLVGGILLGLLAWLSSGSAGPGRLVDVGPNPFAVGGWAALEFAIAATVALLVSGRRADPVDR